MSTVYVPVVAVLPKADYLLLAETLAGIELPADARQIIAHNGWTGEQVLLGRLLSGACEAIRAESTQGEPDGPP